MIPTLTAESPVEDRIVVCNVRGHERWADLRVYCGRGEAPHGLSHARLGNPFTNQQWGRGSAIARFEGRMLNLKHDDWEWKVIRRLAKRLHEGKTIQLFCWCAPAACHCDVIRRLTLETYKTLYCHDTAA